MKKLLLILSTLLSMEGFAQNANALHFDGVDDYVLINDNDGQRIVVNDFTLEFWMKTTQVGGSGTHWFNGNGIIDANVAGVNNDWGVSLIGSKLAFGVGNPDLTIVSNADVNTGQWVHVAVNWHANQSVRIYINGSLDQQQGSGVTFFDRNVTAIRMGCLQTNTGFYQGELSEVRFYNGNLNSAQIQNDMFCTSPSTTDAYYDFSDGVPLGNNTGVVFITDKGNLAQGGNATLNNFALSGSTSNFTSFTLNAISSNKTTVNDGEVQFASVVPAGSPNYQWQRNTGTGFTNISGANSSTYAASNLNANDEIRLVVYGNACGIEFGFNSNAILLTGGTLPLKLISFTVQEINCTPLLTWQTAEEVNVSHFEIEQSTNGIEFRRSTSMAAKNQSGNRYQISLHSEGRRQFYRLKMVDIDGKFTYSPVQVLQSNCAPALRIQPNPVQDQLFLYHGEVGETYLIVDMTGRKVVTGVVRNNVQAISASALPIGSYLLVVGDQRIRFLKQK
jgi:hypothetical protein